MAKFSGTLVTDDKSKVKKPRFTGTLVTEQPEKRIVSEVSPLQTPRQPEIVVSPPPQIKGMDVGEAPSILDKMATTQKRIATQPVDVGAALEELKDVALGVPETIAAVTHGFGSFIPALAVGAGELLKGTMAGAPMEGFKAAKEEMERFMVETAPPVTTKSGAASAGLVALPFTEAHSGIDKIVRSAGGGDKEVSAAQFLFDAAIVVVPALSKTGKIPNARKAFFRRQAQKAGIDSNVINNVLKDKNVINTIKQEALKTDPKIDVKLIDKALKDLQKLERIPLKKGDLPAKFNANQFIIDKLIEDVAKRKGAKARNYEKMARAIAEHPEDVKTFDTGTIFKSKDSKVRKRVVELIKERDATKVATKTIPEQMTELLGKPEQVENFRKAGITDELKQIQEIIRDGVVQKLDTGKALVEKGKAKGKDAFIQMGEKTQIEARANIETLRTLNDPRINAELDAVVERFKIPEPSRKLAQPTEPGIVPLTPGRGEFVGIDEPKVADIPTKAREVSKRMAKMVEIKERIRKPTREIIEEPLDLDELPEPTELDLRETEDFLINEVKSLEPEKIAEKAPEEQARTVEDLMEMYKNYRERYVEKINTAKAPDTTPLDQSKMAPLDNNFKTFKTREAAQEYAAENGIDAQLITDPLTGETYLEPQIERLEDFSWETGVEDVRDVIDFDRGYEGGSEFELSDTGTRALWDILNNERGSVELGDFKIVAERLRALKAQAERLGKDVSELLSDIGMTPEDAQKILDALAKLPRLQEEIRKADPQVEGILHPPGPAVKPRKSGKIQGKRKGSYRTVPLTVKDVGEVFKAPKLPNTGIFNKFLDTNEVRPRAFDRMGPYFKERLFETFEIKELDIKNEREAKFKESNDIYKGLTKQEQRDLAIIGYSRQAGMKKVLAEMGITEIPQSTPKIEAALEYFRTQYDMLLDRVNYVRTNTGRAPIPKTENYLTVLRAFDELKKLGKLDSVIVEPIGRIQAMVSEFKDTPFPYAKPRSKSKIPIELDVLNAYQSYVDGILRDIHMAPVAALAKELALAELKVEGKTLKLTETNPTMARILSKWGDEILHIDNLTAALRRENPVIYKTLQRIRAGLVPAVLAGNPGTMLKQPLPLARVWADTTTVDTMMGILDMMFKHGDDRPANRSVVLKIRTMDLVISDLANKVARARNPAEKIGALRDAITAGIMQGISIPDALTAEAGWNAGYRYARKRLKMNDKKAFKFAEDLVRRTQAMGIRGAVAPIQTSPIGSLGTVFQTFGINDFNYIITDVFGIRRANVDNPRHWRRAIKFVMGGWLVNEMFAALNLDRPTPAPVDAFVSALNDGSNVGAATYDALLEFAEAIPPIGGSLKYGSNIGGPVAEYLGDISVATSALSKNINWNDLSDRQKLHAALMYGKLLGVAFKIPMTGAIAKSIRTASQGGDPWEIIMGIYIEEEKKRSMPQRPRPPRLDRP